MLSFLKRPYYTNVSLLFRLKQATLFGFFVFAFLYVFRPFGIDNLGERLPAVSLGFGLVTFLSMVLLNIILPLFFKDFYSERGWTLGKEILQTLLNITVIGAFNFLFFSFFISHNFSWAPFLWFQFSAFAVGAFPVSIYLILKEKGTRHKYEKEAKLLTGGIKKAMPGQEIAHLITFEGQNSRENLTIPAQSLLYIQASDNYLDIFFEDKTVQRHTVRATLKSAEKRLESFPFFLRCHRSYIVNLEKVYRITGNAQGYKLHLEGAEEPVPVSRQYNDLVKERFTTRH
jgi:hypothetical protein